MFPIGLILIALVMCFPVSLFAQIKPSVSVIPLIGCSVSVQGDLVPAQKNGEKAVQLDEKVAGSLAYYKLVQGPLGVLAPRGWYCFGGEGAAANTLFVTPDPAIKDDDLYTSSSWHGFTGPVIQVTYSYGDNTLGSLDAARVVARVFPAHKDYVREVIKTEPFQVKASEVPFGPYPEDKLKYLNDHIVEYETPSNAIGIGTKETELQKGDTPVSGAIMLENGGLMILAIRLPPAMNALKSDIIRQFEQDNKEIQKLNERTWLPR